MDSKYNNVVPNTSYAFELNSRQLFWICFSPFDKPE